MLLPMFLKDAFDMTRRYPRDLASALKAKTSNSLDGQLKAAKREVDELRELVRQAEIAAKSVRPRSQPMSRRRVRR